MMTITIKKNGVPLRPLSISTAPVSVTMRLDPASCREFAEAIIRHDRDQHVDELRRCIADASDERGPQ